jgi:hypothetical protein
MTMSRSLSWANLSDGFPQMVQPNEPLDSFEADVDIERLENIDRLNCSNGLLTSQRLKGW